MQMLMVQTMLLEQHRERKRPRDPRPALKLRFNAGDIVATVARDEGNHWQVRAHVAPNGAERPSLAEIGGLIESLSTRLGVQPEVAWEYWLTKDHSYAGGFRYTWTESIDGSGWSTWRLAWQDVQPDGPFAVIFREIGSIHVRPEGRLAVEPDMPLDRDGHRRLRMQGRLSALLAIVRQTVGFQVPSPLTAIR